MTNLNWERLQTKLKQDYKPSVTLIRSKMREVLGFTPREFQSWNPTTRRYIEEIHLDFFSEPKRTLFLLKYSEYLLKDKHES